MKKLFLILACLILNIITTNSQTILSQVWDGVGGELAVFHKSTTKTDSQRNVYVVGSTLNVNNNTDIIIQKFNREGALLWQQTYNGAANMNDLAADVFIDLNGNVFVTGTSIENITDDLDLIVLKYNSSGSLQWNYIYNNAASPLPQDAGVSIIGDNNYGIYVTGFSFENGSMADYITIKLNSDNGNQMWESRYDYIQLNDVAAKIEINGANVVIAGASQSTLAPNKWELTTITYNASNGVFVSERRSSGNATNGINEIYDLTVDNSGNIYVAGATLNQITGYDISVYKLDNLLNILWEQHFDGYGLDDKGNGLKVDGQGNVYVCGHVTSASEGKNFSLIKYNSSGVLQWSKEFNGLANSDDEAIQLVIDASNRIFVTGVAFNTSFSDYETLGFLPGGELFLQVEYNGPSGLNDKPCSIAIDLDGNLIVAGQTQIPSGNFKNRTVKYAIYEKSFDIVYDSGIPSHNKGEVLIRFDKNSIIHSSIDKQNFDAGKLSDYVHATVLDEMNAKLGFDVSRFETYKVFRGMTTADSISITRQGDTVKIDEFWATLSVFFPEQYDEQEIADSLNTLNYRINYAEKNYIGELDSQPNDPIYVQSFPNGQTGLHDPTHGIEVENAWNRQVGQNYIKVGVFDTGVNWRHEDFGNGTYSGSKIKGGWDFSNDVHPSNQSTPDPHGHGTACAGIIGALRNNSKGIAGVAGGDMQNGNYGAQLFSMKIAQGATNFVSHATISRAIVEGAVNIVNSGYGYGLHVQNHSWGTSQNSFSLKSAVNTCYFNGCSFVSASGNDGGPFVSYPNSYKDEWVLKVGANDASGNRWSSSNFGHSLDIIAPGTSDIYATLDDENNSGYSYSGSGTSFAAPHAAGVAALLYSQHNTLNGYPNNLSPEDVEVFLQSFATDIPPTNYDIETGHGRINADLSLEKLSLPEFHVKHGGGQNNILVNQLLDIYVAVADNQFGISNGYYIGNRYQYTRTFVDVLPTNQTIIGFWPRLSASIGVSAANPVTGETWYSYSNSYNQNISTTTTITYSWLIKYNMQGQSIFRWIPNSPFNVKTSYSLYVRDNSVNKINNESEYESKFQLYPNPSNKEININYELKDPTDVRLEVMDATGKIVVSQNFGNQIGYQTLTLNISNLSNGLYLCNLITGSSIISKRIVKN